LVKTKTIFHVLEVPRDQDQGLETTSLSLCHTGDIPVLVSCHVVAGVPRETFFMQPTSCAMETAVNNSNNNNYTNVTASRAVARA